MRALHEAVQLLNAISFHLEEDAVRRWLAGAWIRPAEAREIQGRKQALADERMRELGMEPEGGDLVQLGRDLYGSLSESAHHQRGGFRESVAPALASSSTARIPMRRSAQATSSTEVTFSRKW